MPSIPPPADAPDDGFNATWNPTTYPDTIAGVVESRTTLKFVQPRGDRTTFQKLVVERPDGQLVDVLGGRVNLARLITKHDPQPGDGISITAFGADDRGAFQYGMNVAKGASEADANLDQEALDMSAGEISRAVNAPFGEERAS